MSVDFTPQINNFLNAELGEEVRGSLVDMALALQAAINGQIISVDPLFGSKGQAAEAYATGEAFTRSDKINEKKYVANGYSTDKDLFFNFTDSVGKIGAAIRYGSVVDGNTRSDWYSVKYDFAVADKNGNIAFAYKGGEIISSLGAINNRLIGKTFSVLGDSISTYDGYNPTGYSTYYPQGDVNNVSKTWWKQLEQKTGMVLLKNASWAGSGVTGDTTDTTGYCAASDARIEALAGDNDEKPDVIIVYITTNDWKLRDAAIGTFTSTDELPADGTISTISPAYALMLSKIRTAYPDAEVFCCLNLEGRPDEDDPDYPYLNGAGESIHQVNHAIAEIAHIFGARVIDLETSGITYWNVANYTVDVLTTHPNAAGMTVIADTINKTLNY